MKILYHNLYEGCREAWRFKAVIAFINKIQPDILGLSELNGWEKDDFKKLKDFKRQTGFIHHAFAKASSGYHLGLFSRTRLKNVRILEKGFNTGMIKAGFSLNGRSCSVILTHLHHINEDARLKELKMIFKNLDPKQPALLMGDLNSLSPLDDYPEQKLLRQLAGMKLEKFGTDRLRRDVIGAIMDLGMIDAIKVFSRDRFQRSVPTAYDKDPKHFTKLRLDYMFATESLMAWVKSAKIVKNRETGMLSDHYPLLMELKTKKG